jgi:hypothetical protein
MKTKEQQAEEYSPKYRATLYTQLYSDLRQKAFIAGYEAAQRWVPISEEPIPLDALCIAVAAKGGRINCNFKTESDRDAMCKLYGFTHWLPIPKLPIK